MVLAQNLVGKGGYAEVYRSVLKCNEEIAVKRITKTMTDERKEEFSNEIGTIGHVCHPNVLSLVGCCIDNGLYLIFHFSSRGSVASLLYDESLPPMDWKCELLISSDYLIKTLRGYTNYVGRNKESWEEKEDEESVRKKKRLSEGTRIPLKVCHLANAVTANSVLGTNVG